MFHARNSSQCFSRNKRNLIIYLIAGIGCGGQVRCYHPRYPWRLHGRVSCDFTPVITVVVQVFSSNRGDATAVCGDVRKPKAGKRRWSQIQDPTKNSRHSTPPPYTRRILFYSTTRAENSFSLSPSLSGNIKSRVLQVSDLPLSLQIIPCILRPLDTLILLVEATPTATWVAGDRAFALQKQIRLRDRRALVCNTC
jgi:hypothetical protein